MLNCKEIGSQRYRLHCLGCMVAILINLVWAAFNFINFKADQWEYTAVHILVSVVTLAALIVRKKMRFSPDTLGLIPMLATITAASYTYNTVDLESFRSVTYIHAAVFIGAGMFLLWHWKYSVISVAYALIINFIFYIAWSPISVHDYFTNGAELVTSVALFMIISIQTRYILVQKEIEIRSRLRKSEAKSRLLINTAMDGIITFDESYNIIMFNPAAQKMFNYYSGEVSQTSIKLLIPEIEKTEPIKSMEERNTKYGFRKNGEKFPIEYTIAGVKSDGEIYYNAIVRDITIQHKNKKELIKAKQEAIKSKELQSQFLSNMSHEIRTPMNGIIGISRILSGMDMTAEQRYYLNAIIKSSENLMVIINDILDFSKIEAGKIVIEKTPFDIHSLIDVIYEILIVKAQEKGIYLTVDKDNIPQYLVGDPVRLNQILLNLIGNAIKFTDHGGVSVSLKELTQKEGVSTIQFNITDTGIGIPEDKIGKIFESFTQASSSTTRTHGGTGLGLTISKELIRIQGGELSIKSEPGKGSTFSFTLEYKIAENADLNDEDEINQQESSIRVLNKLEGINVLLVEDHPINQMLALKILRDWNFSVDLAENGIQAIDMVNINNYDIVLMDISMPEMDGYEATRQIRKNGLSANPFLPIIAMTASALAGESQKAFKAGMNDYISKPFNPTELLNKINKHVSLKLKRA